MNNYGNFSSDGKTYIINTPNTPCQWQNYIWNKEFLTIFSQIGQGKALKQDSNGVRTNLITSRMVYIIDADSNEFWTANGIPVHKEYKDFKAIHGLGFSSISLMYNDIKTTYRVFVPQNDNCEIWTITLENTGNKRRKIRLVPYFGTAIHGAHEGSFPAAHASFNESVGAVIGSNVVRFGSHFSHETVGRTEDGFFTMDSEISGFDSNKRKFVGEYYNEQTPLAIINGGCTNSVCEFEEIAFALQTDLVLEPGESRIVNTIAGITAETDEISRLKNKYFSDDCIEKELKRVNQYFIDKTNNVNIKTNDSLFDNFFNVWLKHQLNFNSLWARVYFNGYRDLAQDAMSYVVIDKETSKQRFLKVLSYQYASGYAPRAWGENVIIDQDYSDSPVWIALTINSILNEEDDYEYLNINVPFIDGEADTVYNHMKRSVDYLWNDRGTHGLSKIHSGDWNDVMNGVGAKGKGESVWLSMALYLALEIYMKISLNTNNLEEYEISKKRLEELKKAINTHGWDGDYYLRGYTDDSVPVGSKNSESGKLFLNTQSWGIISNVADEEKALKALQNVDEYLECDIGISTLYGLFDKFREDIGFISAIRPGENLNGGIYLHANMFKALADCIMKRNDIAFRTIEKTLPFSKYRNIEFATPYVLSNSYFGPGSGYRYGEAGASWITGSCGWLTTIIVNYIFGLQPEKEGLRINPCLPSEWENCSITRKFRGAFYNINFVKEKGKVCNGIEKIVVNNELINSDILPCENDKEYDVKIYLL